MQGSPVETQTSTHWNLIGRSMIALRPLLSPNSILPAPSSHCAFIAARKISVRVSKMLVLFF
jgi:hypothetical protein